MTKREESAESGARDVRVAQDESNEQATRIERLESIVRQLTGQGSPKPTGEQTDYVERGSDEHAGLLGLRKATEDDTVTVDGWTFEDITQYGPTASVEFLKISLRQKVSELTSDLPEVQSVDPRAPHYAPPMWRPERTL